jgi:hypothetical protein
LVLGEPRAVRREAERQVRSAFPHNPGRVEKDPVFELFHREVISSIPSMLEALSCQTRTTLPTRFACRST